MLRLDGCASRALWVRERGMRSVLGSFMVAAICLAGTTSAAQDNVFAASSVHDISRAQIIQAISGTQCETPPGANNFLYFQSAENEYELSFFARSGQAVRTDLSSRVTLRRMEGDYWLLICRSWQGRTLSIPIAPGPQLCIHSMSGAIREFSGGCRGNWSPVQQ